MENEIKVLGVNDDRDTCDCCGKRPLKRVVWLEINGGEPVAYGTSCAARALGMQDGKYTAKTAERLVTDYNARQERRAKWLAICERAQLEANRCGAEVGVWSKDGGFYSGQIRPVPSYLFRFPRAVFKPQV